MCMYMYMYIQYLYNIQLNIYNNMGVHSRSCYLVAETVCAERLGGSVGTSHSSPRDHRRLGGPYGGHGTVLLHRTPSTPRGAAFPRQWYGSADRFCGLASAHSPAGGSKRPLPLDGEVEAVLVGMHQTIDLEGKRVIWTNPPCRYHSYIHCPFLYCICSHILWAQDYTGTPMM